MLKTLEATALCVYISRNRHAQNASGFDAPRYRGPLRKRQANFAMPAPPRHSLDRLKTRVYPVRERFRIFSRPFDIMIERTLASVERLVELKLPQRPAKN
jgi:hypothetical protein